MLTVMFNIYVRLSHCSRSSRHTVCQQSAVARFQSQPMFWNTLPDYIQSAPSVSAFRRLLKTFLFQLSFPDVILQTPVLRSRGLLYAIA